MEIDLVTSTIVFNAGMVILIIILLVGFTTANHMRLVESKASSELKTAMDTVLADTEKASQTLKDNAEKQKLSDERAKKLAELNGSIDEATNKALEAQAKSMAEDLAAANVGLVYAPPQAETYVVNPQYTLNFYKPDNTRAYVDDKDKTFREKFISLTKDGVVFE